MTDTSPLLRLSSIGKRFGGLSALSDVTLHIKRGEIYGLIGPNGAGKTTLFNIITGLYQLEAGEFQFNGTRYQSCKPHVLAKAGIARTFQNIRLFANMTAGHTMLKVFAGFSVSLIGISFGAVLGILPVLVNMALLGLETMIAFIQAYVFAILTCIYIKSVIELH